MVDPATLTSCPFLLPPPLSLASFSQEGSQNSLLGLSRCFSAAETLKGDRVSFKEEQAKAQSVLCSTSVTTSPPSQESFVTKSGLPVLSCLEVVGSGGHAVTTVSLPSRLPLLSAPTICVLDR